MNIKSLFLSLLVLLVLPFASSNYMNYSIQLNNDNADLNLEMSLENATPVNVFNGSIVLPENTEVLKMSDSKGEIKDFTVQGNILKFSTNYSIAKELEVVKISMKLKNIKNNEFAPLYSSRISMPAMPDSNVFAIIHGTGFISFETNHGFNGTLTPKKIEIQGIGPASIKFYYSQKGRQWQHYVVFNESSLGEVQLKEKGFNDAELYFNWLPKITGIEPPFEKFPIVILNDNEFEQKVNSYSEGVYRTGGLIIVRASVFEENAAPVILHETMHGFNAQAMSWNESKASWFDEGMAKFIEFLARKKLGMHLSNLFNGINEYREGNYVIKMYPANTLQQLMDYYAKKETFIEEWNPAQDKNREFGYSFGELFVRTYVKEKGFNELLKAYKEFLKQEKEIKDAHEFTKTLLSILGAKLEPCNYATEEKVKECLKEINEFNPQIPDTNTIIKLGLVKKEKEIEGLEKVKEIELKKWVSIVKKFNDKINEINSIVFTETLSIINSFMKGETIK